MNVLFFPYISVDLVEVFYDFSSLLVSVFYQFQLKFLFCLCHWCCRLFSVWNPCLFTSSKGESVQVQVEALCAWAGHIDWWASLQSDPAEGNQERPQLTGCLGLSLGFLELQRKCVLCFTWRLSVCLLLILEWNKSMVSLFTTRLALATLVFGVVASLQGLVLALVHFCQKAKFLLRRGGGLSSHAWWQVRGWGNSQGQLECLTASYINSPNPPALPSFSEIPGTLKFRFYTYPYTVRPTAQETTAMEKTACDSLVLRGGAGHMPQNHMGKLQDWRGMRGMGSWGQEPLLWFSWEVWWGRASRLRTGQLD